MALEGKNISLHPYSSRFKEVIESWMNTWDALDHYRDDVLIMPLEHEAWGGIGTLIIVRTRDEKPLGFVRILDQTLLHRRGRLDFHLVPEYRKLGYGLEATILSMHYCFSYLNFHKVFLTIYESNKHAISVADKLGFVLDGKLRQHIRRNQRYQDVLIYSLLREEYSNSFIIQRLSKRFLAKPQKRR